MYFHPCSSSGVCANADQGAFRIRLLCQLCLGLWGRLGFCKVSQMKPPRPPKKDKLSDLTTEQLFQSSISSGMDLGSSFQDRFHNQEESEISGNFHLMCPSHTSQWFDFSFDWFNIRASRWKMAESQTRLPRSRGASYNSNLLEPDRRRPVISWNTTKNVELQFYLKNN